MLDRMLERIDDSGPLAQDVPTLQRLHRAWRTSVPYENLDIQLQRPIRLDLDSIYDKIILNRRGGYCFEQNGGLDLLLRVAGFDVTMVEAAVLRADRGDEAWGNHNALLVAIDGQRWLADAGIGDGFLEPLPLRPGTHRPSDGATALLLSRTIRTLGAGGGPMQRRLASRTEFTDALRDEFLIPTDTLGAAAVDALWQQSCQQDEQWRARAETAPSTSA